ncbi:MAG: hypothetical protein QM743_07370 [Chitinophagaceae bacterium]
MLQRLPKHVCYSDDEYRREGVEVVTDMSDCDVLLGVKEVPKQELIPAKRTSSFFAYEEDAALQ